MADDAVTRGTAICVHTLLFHLPTALAGASLLEVPEDRERIASSLGGGKCCGLAG